jgi:hypothetical protein
MDKGKEQIDVDGSHSALPPGNSLSANHSLDSIDVIENPSVIRNHSLGGDLAQVSETLNNATTSEILPSNNDTNSIDDFDQSNGYHRGGILGCE